MVTANYGDIAKRPDGSFVIKQGDLPYHVLDNEENAELYADVLAYAEANPHRVKQEPSPPEPLHKQSGNAKIGSAGEEGDCEMSELLGERMARIEAGFEFVQKGLAGIRATIIITAIAALGIAIAIMIGFATIQESHVQKLIDAHQKTSEARMDEFRRDSDRNYDLALRALERSIAADTKGAPAE